MPFYKKRPVIIDANEWTGGRDSARDIIGWAFHHDVQVTYHEGDWVSIKEVDTWVPEHLKIDTLEGVMTAQVGDFIIRGVQNEFYPCKPDIFWQTYEEL